jgi:hypothetical protein
MSSLFSSNPEGYAFVPLSQLNKPVATATATATAASTAREPDRNTVIDKYTKLIEEIGQLQRELEDLLEGKRELEKRVNDKKVQKELDPPKEEAPLVLGSPVATAPPLDSVATDLAKPPATSNSDLAKPSATSTSEVVNPPVNEISMDPTSPIVASGEATKPNNPLPPPPDLPAKLIPLANGQIALSNANYPPPTGVTLVPNICISLFDGRDIVDGKIQSVTKNDIVYTPYDAANKRYTETTQRLNINEHNERIDTIKVIKPCLEESTYSKTIRPIAKATNYVTGLPFRKKPLNPPKVVEWGGTESPPSIAEQERVYAQTVERAEGARKGDNMMMANSPTPEQIAKTASVTLKGGRRKRNATKKLRKA